MRGLGVLVGVLGVLGALGGGGPLLAHPGHRVAVPASFHEQALDTDVRVLRATLVDDAGATGALWRLRVVERWRGDPAPELLEVRAPIGYPAVSIGATVVLAVREAGGGWEVVGPSRTLFGYGMRDPEAVGDYLERLGLAELGPGPGLVDGRSPRARREETLGVAAALVAEAPLPVAAEALLDVRRALEELGPPLPDGAMRTLARAAADEGRPERWRAEVAALLESRPDLWRGWARPLLDQPAAGGRRLRLACAELLASAPEAADAARLSALGREGDLDLYRAALTGLSALGDLARILELAPPDAAADPLRAEAWREARRRAGGGEGPREVEPP